MNNNLLKLYITGNTPKSVAAIKNLKKICHQHLENTYKYIIIDIIENPEIAEQEKIFATPTLIREHPQPIRRVIGDLSDIDKVLLALEIYLDHTREKMK